MALTETLQKVIKNQMARGSSEAMESERPGLKLVSELVTQPGTNGMFSLWLSVLISKMGIIRVNPQLSGLV